MILSAENLSYCYPGTKRRIFHNVNIALESGELLSILGANGAGKSTFLNTLAGLFVPASGKVCVDGKDIELVSTKERARIMAYVPQNHAPVYDFTVREFVVMGRTPYLSAFGMPSTRDYEKADRALERVGASYLAERIYTRISGGERQLATIARAIAQEPKFIFLDEPTSHLDFGNQLKAVRMIRSLADEGYGIIMTTHNPDHVLYCGGKTAILKRNGTMEVGSSKNMIKEETLSSLYEEPIHVFYAEEMGRHVCLAGKAWLEKDK